MHSPYSIELFTSFATCFSQAYVNGLGQVFKGVEYLARSYRAGPSVLMAFVSF